MRVSVKVLTAGIASVSAAVVVALLMPFVATAGSCLSFSVALTAGLLTGGVALSRATSSGLTVASSLWFLLIIAASVLPLVHSPESWTVPASFWQLAGSAKAPLLIAWLGGACLLVAAAVSRGMQYTTSWVSPKGGMPGDPPSFDDLRILVTPTSDTPVVGKLSDLFSPQFEPACEGGRQAVRVSKAVIGRLVRDIGLYTVASGALAFLLLWLLFPDRITSAYFSAR